MESCKLIVIRHGETEWNVKGVWQGQKNSPLTERGLQQADAVGLRLSKLQIDKIYSSDLGRCLRTALPAATALGKEVIQDERLRERAFGVLEGLTKEESESKYPGVWEGVSRKDPDYKPEGGESLREKQFRFEEVFRDIAAQNSGKTVVVFTHGGGVDAILRKTIGLTLSQARPYTLWNCSLNVFEVRGDLWTLETLGDVSHLDGIESAFRPR